MAKLRFRKLNVWVPVIKYQTDTNKFSLSGYKLSNYWARQWIKICEMLEVQIQEILHIFFF